IDVMDVPGSLHLRNHDHLELVADLGDEMHEVVQDPWTVEAVDTRPEGGVAEVRLLCDPDEAIARCHFPVGRDRVLEVAEQNVARPRHVRHLRGHLLVARVEEVDHPRGLDGDLSEWSRRADRQRLEEVARVSHRSGRYKTPYVEGRKDCAGISFAR